jgi:hypothetical protein
MSKDGNPSREYHAPIIGCWAGIPKRNSRIKLLFAVVILWQLLQSGITAKFGEPYPALAMPGFAGTMVDRDGNIRFGNVKCKVRFQDGHVGWVTAHDLLSRAPDSNRIPIMAHMFNQPPVTADQWPPHSLKARLFPGRALSRVRNTQRELDPQTKEWLKRRIQVLYPSQEPEVVTFIWYENVFNVNQVPVVTTQEPTGVREVRFQ